MVGVDPKENKDNAFFFLGGGGCGEGGGGSSPSQNVFNPFSVSIFSTLYSIHFLR